LLGAAEPAPFRWHTQASSLFNEPLRNGTGSEHKGLNSERNGFREVPVPFFNMLLTFEAYTPRNHRMDAFVAGVVRAAVEVFPIPEPILEVGSQSIPGQEHLANRHLFPEKEYVGIDLRPGPGVDSVENIEQLEREENSVGTVLALNVLAHVKHFWRGFAEIERVLRPDGLAIISCPFHCHIHAYPRDYWRFTPEALRLLLDSLPTKIIGYNGPRRRPLNVWAVAATGISRNHRPAARSFLQ